MAEAAWRLILSSIATTVFLVSLGEAAADVLAIIMMHCVIIWLQEEVIESIREKRYKHEGKFKECPQRDGHDAERSSWVSWHNRARIPKY